MQTNSQKKPAKIKKAQNSTPTLQALSEQAARLKAAIDQQESLRPVLGDSSVDDAIRLLQAQLDQLSAQQRSASAPTEPRLSEAQATDWRYKLNTQYAHLPRTRGAGDTYPTWVRGWDRDEWEKRGLVFWSDGQQILERLNAQNTLQLLNSLRQDQQWRTSGMRFGIPHVVLHLADEPRGKSRHASKEPEPKSPDRETVYQQISLSAKQTDALLRLLETEEAMLREIARQEEEEVSRALVQVIRIAAARGRAIREEEEGRSKHN